MSKSPCSVTRNYAKEGLWGVIASRGGRKEHLKSNMQFYLFIFKDFIYLFMRDTERTRGRDIGRGRSRLHAGSPMWDSIPGLQDHALG